MRMSGDYDELGGSILARPANLEFSGPWEEERHHSGQNQVGNKEVPCASCGGVQASHGLNRPGCDSGCVFRGSRNKHPWQRAEASAPWNRFPTKPKLPRSLRCPGRP